MKVHIATILATTVGMKGLAIIIIIIGVSIRYWLGRRSFDRRNHFGLEGFKSYKKMRFTRALETFVNLIAGLLILAGIIVFLLALVPPPGHSHQFFIKTYKISTLRVKA